MILIAIVACEIGFWLVLLAGLLARYMLRRRRLGAVLLAGVPLIDIVLLALTVVDLRQGARPEFDTGWRRSTSASRWCSGPPWSGGPTSASPTASLVVRRPRPSLTAGRGRAPAGSGASSPGPALPWR